MRIVSMLLFFLLIPLLTYAATVYTSTDENQNITYSDTPINNAKKIEIPDSTTNSAPEKIIQPQSTTSFPLPVPERKPYTTFLINSPHDQDTLQNQRVIPIEIKIEPELQVGDKVALYVDGVQHGAEATSTTGLTLQQVDRGSHQVYAAIIDSNKTVLKKSNTITLYIMYAHIGGTM